MSKALKPPPRLTVSEWADRHRRLSSESSAEPGQWSTDRAPHQRGIMDALNERDIHTIVICTSAQIGKSEVINNIAGYFIAYDPCPIMLMQPTVEMAEAYSKDRIAPMLRDTPVLAERVGDPKSRNTGNTINQKKFPGGYIQFVGANAPSALASRPVRVLLADEVDRYPSSAGSEGDPVKLAEKRTTTFWNRKRVYTSTPTVEGVSRIWQLYEQSDMRQRWLPCPQCGEFHILEFQNMKWETRDGPVFFVCPHCGGAITERDKPAMLRAGEWRSQRDTNGIAGFHLWEAYSPWVKWSEIRDNFLAAKDDPEQFKTWVNTSLGELWRGAKGGDARSLWETREDYPHGDRIPDGARAITAAVDVQDDRLEVGFEAWGVNEENWKIDYLVIPGDLGTPTPWETLASVIRRQFKAPNNTLHSVDLVCIDSGGHFTDEVYNFSRSHGPRWVIPIKGSNTRGRPVATMPRKPNDKRVYLTMVGTDTAKTVIFDRVACTDPRLVHFPKADIYNLAWFGQFCAEQKVQRRVQGQTVEVWECPRGKRNEAIDVSVYNLAAIRLLQQNGRVSLSDFDRENFSKETPDNNRSTKPKRRARRRGGWMDGYR